MNMFSSDGDRPKGADLLAAMTADTDPYLSCDDCFAQIDVAVEEAMATGVHLNEPFRVHLMNCPACHDEARSLAELIAPDHGLTSERAVECLEADLTRSV